MRNALVTALIACSDSPLRANARLFLQGLSSDELEFIAEYFGACILGEFECCPETPDQDHKLILLQEYLRRSSFPPAAKSS